MITNTGGIDRVVRILIALGLIYFAFGTGQTNGNTLQIVAVLAAAVMALTALFSTCPLYSMLGLSSRQGQPGGD